MHHVQRTPIRPRRYVSPDTLEAAVELLARHGRRARLIAGGTDLMVELDRRVGAEVDVMIDLSRIHGLDTVETDTTTISLGPLVTHNQCATDTLVIDGALALAQACAEVGSPALRNRATVVGNLVTASPANDTISALVALDARLTLTSAGGSRSVPLEQFHTGPRSTVLRDDELVSRITIPVSPSTRSVFVKSGLRRAQAISVVHVSIAFTIDGGGRIVDPRIALGSVAPTIVRATRAESLISGEVLRDLSPELRARSAAAAATAVTPIDDLRSPADYRSEQLEIMVARALAAMAADAEAATYARSQPTLGGPSVTNTGAPRGQIEFDDGDAIEAEINGAPVSGSWIPGSLLDWLRARPGLTGTKEGCAEGECGACTVHVEGTAVLSCLVPAGRAHGTSITTIEGLAPDGRLHRLQQSFVACSSSQCGYCIPGFLMAGAALLADEPEPSPATVTAALSGNLCRCTGYRAIEAAFMSPDVRPPR